MQTHTTRGWALASRIPGLSPVVLEVIRRHHEHWDGSGYPDGLAGNEIPFLARVVAVCDVYDALISERPYKRAWSDEATLEEIQAQSGRLFDPEMVRAFTAFRHLPDSQGRNQASPVKKFASPRSPDPVSQLEGHGASPE